MTRERTYRCLDCLEHTLSRPFDVSHLSVTCPVCESFQRFVNEGVYDQYRALEEDPPDHLDWSRLGKVEKLMLSDGIVRESHDIEDFELQAPPEEGDDADEDAESDPDTDEPPEDRATRGDRDESNPDGAAADAADAGSDSAE